MNTEDIADGICSIHGELSESTNFRITPEHIIVDKCLVHHGLKDKDPVSRMRFLRKSDMSLLTASDYKNLPNADSAHQSEYESFLPVKLMQCKLRIFCRDSSEEICNLMTHQFEQVRFTCYFVWKSTHSCEKWFDDVCAELKMTDDGLYEGDYNVLTQENSDSEDDFDNAVSPRRLARPSQPMSITPPNHRTNTSYLDAT
jgi:hypothetical protein